MWCHCGGRYSYSVLGVAGSGVGLRSLHSGYKGSLFLSQQSMVAADIANLKHGQRADSSQETSVTIPQAAETVGVSAASVKRAAKVKKKGIDAVGDAVRKGNLDVTVAAKIVDLPENISQETFITIPQALSTDSDCLSGLGDGYGYLL